MRVSAEDSIRMPPLAHQKVDLRSVSLLKRWIQSLPGPAVLAPPVISPRGGEYSNGVEVTLHEDEPGVSIRYTLDGSAPTASDPIYDKPLKLTGPTVLRAKAFKAGFTKSITVQEVFIING
jgi:Chitobiase/beta-hexosaminidase C-terminal domain